MGSFSVAHWLIVLLIVVLVFGTKRLRNIGADLGAAARNFKNASKEGSEPEDSEPAAGRGEARSLPPPGQGSEPRLPAERLDASSHDRQR